MAAAGESDEIERWLDAEFEAPAEEAIDKVVTERRLKPSDWRLLARFFAAQDVRTPARLVENMTRWRAVLPGLLQSTLVESVAQFEAMTPAELAELPKRGAGREELPFRVSIERREGELGGWLKGETVSGRALWTWSMRELLMATSHAMQTLQSTDGRFWRLPLVKRGLRVMTRC
jgi:hypothetical protein